jgi:hypothetical protein
MRERIGSQLGHALVRKASCLKPPFHFIEPPIDGAHRKVG